VQHNATMITLSSDVRVSAERVFNLVTPGEFIQIGGQEFRVCLNQDDTFVQRFVLRQSRFK
jgi:hypothetical protein